MEAPGYWDQVEQSQAGMRELNTLKEEKEKFESLQEQYEDIETLLEMGYEENDESLIPEIQEDTVRLLMHVKIEEKAEREEVAQVTGTNKDDSLGKKPVQRAAQKVYPNDPCPCGSGKKYKQCCGRAK